MNPKVAVKRFSFLLLLFSLCAGAALAQTTSFTYQGKLSDGGTAANGNYDLQFALFDGAAGGSQVGATQTLNTVAVSGGIFAVTLDFGGSALPGASRFLEIRARLAGGGAFTTLAPRQQISSTPYAIRSLNATAADTATTATSAINATQLGGVAASQYVQTNDARLSDPRPPAAGSSNYIQNSSVPQAGANFNVSGNGTVGGTLSANIVNTAMQYNIGGNRVFSILGTNNVFAGEFAGVANTGSHNSFFGREAGKANTSGFDNAFVGSFAGSSNTTGFNNSFFGSSAGSDNTTGSLNSFFGRLAGRVNTTGGENSFFGRAAGVSNTTGAANSFFGTSAGAGNTSAGKNSFFGNVAGFANTTGFYNSFFGSHAGTTNKTGDKNTAIGYGADVESGDLTNATAIGASAAVSQSNSLVLGSITGVNLATADTNVGIGTTAPKARLHVAVSARNILMGDAGCSSPYAGIGFGASLSGCANYSLLGNGTDTIINRPTGGIISFRENNSTQMSIASGGAVSIATLGSAGSTSLCRNASNQISTCSSSRRYKEQIFDFGAGLKLLNRLRPVQFVWKADQQPDLGLVAEEVAEVEPLLVIHNDKGEIEGVKYTQLNVVLINAIKQQQSQIETLRLANAALNTRLRAVERNMTRVGVARRR